MNAEECRRVAASMIACGLATMPEKRDLSQTQVAKIKAVARDNRAKLGERVKCCWLNCDDLATRHNDKFGNLCAAHGMRLLDAGEKVRRLRPEEMFHEVKRAGGAS